MTDAIRTDSFFAHPATADFLRTVICDAVIAPGFDPGTAELLAAKRDGRFLVLEANPERVPPATERRDVLGVTIEQDRDRVPVATALPDDGTLDAAIRADALLGLVTLRYTQSNSVALVRGGAAIGIGAGQQNRVDCVRLAAAKARTWWLRRHPFVDDLPPARRRTASRTCRPACGSSTTEERLAVQAEPGSVRTKDFEFSAA